MTPPAQPGRSFVELGRHLEAALRERLPGASAHDVLAPRPRHEWPVGFDPSRIRHAAGLLLLVPFRAQAHVVLTVRAQTLGRHGGQISLPGGVVEPGESHEQAALREAHEEIALPLAAVRVLGSLTPLDVPVSGFRLYPIVAVAEAGLPLTPAGGEVARIVHVPLAALAHPRGLVTIDRVREGRPMTVPAFRVAGEEIWGATAMVLAELLVLLGWRPERTDGGDAPPFRP